MLLLVMLRKFLILAAHDLDRTTPDNKAGHKVTIQAHSLRICPRAQTINVLSSMPEKLFVSWVANGGSLSKFGNLTQFDKMQPQSIPEAVEASTQYSARHRSENPSGNEGDEEQDENDNGVDTNGVSVDGNNPDGGGRRGRGRPTGTKGQTGHRCERCILQHKRCDAVKPVCGNCAKRKRNPDCHWPGAMTRSQLQTVRHENTTSSAAAPSLPPKRLA
ncbi:uncharacterized protein Z520_03094 [Fonsecaea multimorphosa CBS 102226]|uniref:Zn(2)-C6 fungal-type domain-containing protein n=1 Tax=Fonsecaea multimorphosa CBS 102226 TaxID=1442371 RepID=A0A0D2IX11_9EURO|nr:uncharacterized protein Z520_03094 [Fonsecaea multimorphosa CBS 102226]KIY01542.1 hypothetical protein Z520_03094 [Fonsecaea multimorphosa CBS 102226]OAL28056.1 hypothetical protein AYO22_03083 [Fonsecaea multimorphosa]